MRIAVIGAGNVGRTLAAAWRRAGHDVRTGVRDPARYPDLPGVQAVPGAVAGADVVLLAVPGAALADLLATHAGRLAGALVIDATNAVGAGDLHQLPLLTAALPAARIARAFCTVGFEAMADPVFDGERADLFWCGPEGEDARTVEALVGDVGMRPVRVGGLDAAAVVDGVARLWFALAFGQGRGREHALRVLDREPQGPRA